jgi:hypothetical protein
MLVVTYFCIAMSGQIPAVKSKPAVAPKSASKQVEAPSIRAGSIVRVGPSFAGTSFLGLNYLAYLTYHDKGSVEIRKDAIDALAQHQLVVELEKPTRVIIQNYLPDPRNKRNTVYRGRVLEGHKADIAVYFYAGQISDPIEDAEPPGVMDDKKREIYKAVRKALKKGELKASFVDPSIRKKAMEREEGEAIRSVAKQFGLAIGLLEEIIRLGEIEDGRMAKREEDAFRHMMKAQNAAMLAALERQFNAQLADVMRRAQAQSSAQLFYPPAVPVGHLGPGVVIYGALGHPMDKMTFTDGGASVRPLGR